MLGNIASIATLILFVIYFIGRIISLIIEKKVIYEKIDIYANADEMPKDIKIVDEYRCKYYNEILGRKAVKDIKANTPLKSELIDKGE